MKIHTLLRVALVAAVLTVGIRGQDKPCSTASKFGPADQIGNVNYITPAKTLAASKLVTKGKAYRLGIETNKDTPAYGARKFAITVDRSTPEASMNCAEPWPPVSSLPNVAKITVRSVPLRVSAAANSRTAIVPEASSSAPL